MLIFILIFGLFAPFFSNNIVTKVAAATNNLFANSSAEMITNNIPDSWQKNNWGSNNSNFTIKSGYAQDGNKSLLIYTNYYADGDAKWYPNHVSVSPNTSYVFSDYYKASANNEVIVQFMDVAGNFSYQSLGNGLKQYSWTNFSNNFQTPSNVKSLTVFHVIKSTGFLEIDSFNLHTLDPSSITNNVPNFSLEETVNNVEPLDWQKSGWGTHTTAYTYLSSGHNSNHSIKVQTSKYTGGDAKWSYTPQPVLPGDYKFTDYYKSNIVSKVIVWVIKNDNSNLYIGLKDAPASNSWTQYSDIFSLPPDTKAASVFHLISAVGWLITDEYSLTPYQIQGFNRALISLNFDDLWEANLSTAFPVMDQYGYKSTQFITTEYIASTEDRQQIKAFYDNGHEIGSHTVTHPFLTKVSSRVLYNELYNSKNVLESIVGKGNVSNFATPYGDYSPSVTTAIGKYYQSNRNTDVGWNSKENFNRYNIVVQNMLNTTTLAEFQSWVDKAIHDKTWLVIVYHRVGDNPGPYETTLQNFQSQMQYINQNNLTVKPINTALAEILPQL